ncbi:adhesion G protein-coupled receptor E1-like isoform X2 [Acipenser oxyrinchus oxyrinchus]|uniref:Adhesion G protein-coupled receptor E1-like isoform X2 n=1 Tax=Acipenser oxyrinchus oxyrinchus TaxID=40147 RepID=A0AAD8CLL1_ACIOX|nr:adhesion G protein-coupled receptor E1-like isoform X2 [Acipenser oxyrinchus oxyrinchus]
MQASYRLLLLGICIVWDQVQCSASSGRDECADPVAACPANSTCFDTLEYFYCQCVPGYRSTGKHNFTDKDRDTFCKEINECRENSNLCGQNASCQNTIGNYSCSCKAGFRSSSGQVNFMDGQSNCTEINECRENSNLCGQNASCRNTIGNYSCSCNPGFMPSSGQVNFMAGQSICTDIDECSETPLICSPVNCTNTNGGYQCLCKTGTFPSTGIKWVPNYSKCIELSCSEGPAENEPSTPLGEIQRLLRETCLQQSDQGSPDGKKLLQQDLLRNIDVLLTGPLHKAMISRFFQIVEDAVMRATPLLDEEQTQINGIALGVEIRLSRFTASPQGPVTLGSGNVTLSTDWSTVAGENSSGFAAVALISYYNLEESLNHSFDEDALARENHNLTSVQLNSKVVSAAISNAMPERHSSSVNFTFSHLQLKDSSQTAVCVYWKNDSSGGSWSKDGCETVEANWTHTACRCHHLSSFAVLMALYEFQDTFELQLITWVGLGLSLICLLLSILTFSCCRSVKGTRSTIHLHLCISLFIADLVFLAGISSTSNKGGCALVAGLLHFFFLAVFTWMCLEGIQLYRMVVTVFNATLPRHYMFLFGYGIPALIVGISAAANRQGYGTERYCWLSLDDGFIWSFFGPVCVIILFNILFFVITIWKLAEKFSSVNPDLSTLKKIQVFTSTAVAQLCILGLMWIFGCFQFDSRSLAMSYIFTVLNSFQGVFIFIMHCLLCKQVRDDYRNLLSTACSAKKYSEFSSTSQSASSQGMKSQHDTKESQM